MSKVLIKLRKSVIFTTIFVITFSCFISPAGAATFDREFFSSNDILFYDPDACIPTSGDLMANSASGEGNLSDLPLKAPLIKDPNKLADAIDKWIKKMQPGSPLLGLGKSIVQGGMRAGVNPVLAVVQANMETSLGTNSRAPGVAVHNAWGRTRTSSQPGSGMWYAWPSWEAAVNGGVKYDDWFQYVKRGYKKEWEKNDIKAYLNRYAPPSENDTGGYLRDILKWAKDINLLAGDAIDLTKLAKPQTDLTTTSDGSITMPQSSEIKGVVFIDPGHGAEISEYIDEESGLAMKETDNPNETKNMLNIANRIKTELEKSGYTVVLSRTNNTAPVTFRERADAAKAVKADIGISLHSDTDVNESWAQKVGTYREYNGKKVTFSNQETAKKSQEYNNIIAKNRSQVEGRAVKTDPNNSQQKTSFSRKGIPSKGNIPLISLFADTIPWSYNEYATNDPNNKMTEKQMKEYASGIVRGVLEINPGGSRLVGDECEPEVNVGDLSSATLAYAWPEYKGRNYTKKKQAYADAVDKAISEGSYIGGCKGVDCGGFVTRLVIDSGWDPNYNYSAGKGSGYTGIQEEWARNNWESLGNNVDVAELKPGDVAFSPGHTFIFVGEIPGFDSNIASASLCVRSPMAGQEVISNSSTNWYRKK